MPGNSRFTSIFEAAASLSVCLCVWGGAGLCALECILRGFGLPGEAIRQRDPFSSPYCLPLLLWYGRVSPPSRCTTFHSSFVLPVALPCAGFNPSPKAVSVVGCCFVTFGRTRFSCQHFITVITCLAHWFSFTSYVQSSGLSKQSLLDASVASNSIASKHSNGGRAPR